MTPRLARIALVASCALAGAAVAADRPAPLPFTPTALVVPARPGGMAVPHFDADVLLQPVQAQRFVLDRGALLPAAAARDALRAAALQAGPHAHLTLIGHDDARGREGLGRARATAARELLLASGIAPAVITTRASEAPIDDSAPTVLALELIVARPAPAGPLLALPSDRTVRGLLRRWGAERGVEVLWDDTLPDLPVTRSGRFDANLTRALEQLLTTLPNAASLVATEYGNRVLRIAPAATTATAGAAPASAAPAGPSP